MENTKLEIEWINLDHETCSDLCHEAKVKPWCANIPFNKISLDNQEKLESVWKKRQEEMR